MQNRLHESADLVWTLLNDKGGHFYVCGDASSMAGAVEKELLKVRARPEARGCVDGEAAGSQPSSSLAR